ncbi:MAG: hypothetical protein RL338_1324 [Chloroflexota bacterium]
MPLAPDGAQRASLRTGVATRRRSALSLALTALVALSLVLPGPVAGSSDPAPGTVPGELIVGLAAAAPGPAVTALPLPDAVAAGPRPKVVLVVGPVGTWTTRRYVAKARRLAAIARAEGADVVEIYSPNATWARVREAAAGANVLVYLGHGSGYPNPYGPYDPAKQEGLGLNPRAGAGNGTTRYYGASHVAGLGLAPGSAVILNHLCYASGNNEWGRGNPTRAVAMRRADGFGHGFLRGGASAVFADGIGDPAHLLRGLLRGAATPRELFWGAGHATRRHALAFVSKRTPGAGVLMDPYAPGRYYRSVVGVLDTPISAWGDPAAWPVAEQSATGSVPTEATP